MQTSNFDINRLANVNRRSTSFNSKLLGFELQHNFLIVTHFYKAYLRPQRQDFFLIHQINTTQRRQFKRALDLFNQQTGQSSTSCVTLSTSLLTNATSPSAAAQDEERSTSKNTSQVPSSRCSQNLLVGRNREAIQEACHSTYFRREQEQNKRTYGIRTSKYIQYHL
jgi:hypothetical protein